MTRVFLGALLVTAALTAAPPPPALSCHPCVVGEPCPPHAGCGGDSVDFRRGVVISVTTGANADATRWTLVGRPSRILLPPGLFLRGRIVCRGALCVGRRGRFGADVFLQQFLAQSRFHNGSGCQFEGPLDGTQPASYRCLDAQGRLDSEGPIEVTVRPRR